MYKVFSWLFYLGPFRRWPSWRNMLLYIGMAASAVQERTWATILCKTWDKNTSSIRLMIYRYNFCSYELCQKYWMYFICMIFFLLANWACSQQSKKVSKTALEPGIWSVGSSLIPMNLFGARFEHFFALLALLQQWKAIMQSNLYNILGLILNCKSYILSPMLGLFSFRVCCGIMAHEDIPFCTADAALPTYKNEGD